MSYEIFLLKIKTPHLCKSIYCFISFAVVEKSDISAALMYFFWELNSTISLTKRICVLIFWRIHATNWKISLLVFVLCHSHNCTLTRSMHNVMHDKLLRNITSKYFHNKTHTPVVVRLKWASVSCFHSWGKKNGWMCSLFSVCLVFAVHLSDSIHNNLISIGITLISQRHCGGAWINSEVRIEALSDLRMCSILMLNFFKVNVNLL